MTQIDRLAFLRLLRLARTTASVGTFDLDLSVHFANLREHYGLAQTLALFAEVAKENED